VFGGTRTFTGRNPSHRISGPDSTFVAPPRWPVVRDVRTHVADHLRTWNRRRDCFWPDPFCSWWRRSERSHWGFTASTSREAGIIPSSTKTSSEWSAC